MPSVTRILWTWLTIFRTALPADAFSITQFILIESREIFRVVFRIDLILGVISGVLPALCAFYTLVQTVDRAKMKKTLEPIEF